MSGKMSTTMFVNMVVAASRLSNYINSTKLNSQSPLTRDAVAFSLAMVGENSCAVPKYVTDRFDDIPWAQLRELSSLTFYEARSDYVIKTAHDVIAIIPRLREVLDKIGCECSIIAEMEASIVSHKEEVNK